jgi:hypothetical protein
MAKIIYPSEHSVGTIQGIPTNIMREYPSNWCSMVNNPSRLKSFISYGFEIYSTGSNGVELQYGSGGHYASIAGLLISYDANITLTGLSNEIHYIYAQLSKDGQSITTDWNLVSNTSGIPPEFSVALARVTVTGGVAGSIVQANKNPVACAGSFAGVTSTAVSVYLGFRPSRIEIESLYSGTYTQLVNYDYTYQMNEWQTHWNGFITTGTVNTYTNAIAVIYDYGFVYKAGSSITGVTYRYYATA